MSIASNGLLENRMKYKLVLDHITKTFGALKANDEVSLHARKGSVHAILGENGAGKSTLMNVLYGLYRPDKGCIVLNGREVRIENPGIALDLGIGMVHQNFMLVGRFTAIENTILGTKIKGIHLSLREPRKRLLELSDSFGFEIDLDQPVWKLPVGMQQRVEILKLLYHNVDILILDEPTSVLTPNETQQFFDVILKLKTTGKTILLITHKLGEVMTVSDYVTVMRDGQVITEMATSEATTQALARLMIGRDVLFDVTPEQATHGENVLEVKGLCAVNDRGLPALDNVSFEVKAGEILGIAGVDGNGQTELAETIVGLRSLSAGKIVVDQVDYTHVSVSERRHRARIGYVPEDRQRRGLALDHTVAQNMMLSSYNKPPFARRGMLDLKEIRHQAEILARRYDVRLHDVGQPVRELSGGNQQKLIIARELRENLKILIAAQPTKGLDVGAIEFVQNTIVEQRAKGTAVVYISTELEHLLAVCDYISVIFRGHLTPKMSLEETTSEKIGLLMSGGG